MGSLTTGAGKSDKAKERAKALNRAAKERAARAKEMRELTGADKIEYEIGRLKNTIFNCKQDLKIFKNNAMIINKMRLAEDEMERLIEQLAIITNEDKK